MAPGTSTVYIPTPTWRPTGEPVRVTIYDGNKPPKLIK